VARQQYGLPRDVALWGGVVDTALVACHLQESRRPL